MYTALLTLAAFGAVVWSALRTTQAMRALLPDSLVIDAQPPRH